MFPFWQFIESSLKVIFRQWGARKSCSQICQRERKRLVSDMDRSLPAVTSEYIIRSRSCKITSCFLSCPNTILPTYRAVLYEPGIDGSRYMKTNSSYFFPPFTRPNFFRYWEANPSDDQTLPLKCPMASETLTPSSRNLLINPTGSKSRR